MSLVLSEHPGGVETEAGTRVVYDLDRNEAFFGAARVDGPAIVWELTADPDPGDWIVRCDRVDFPPGGIAHRHVHPGAGVRRILFGELTIDRGDGRPRTYTTRGVVARGCGRSRARHRIDDRGHRVRAGPAPPGGVGGRRTISYLDPADEDKPRLQRATVLLEVPL